MRITRWITLLTLCVAGSGCGEDTPKAKPSVQSAPPVAQETVHAPANVVPGTFEDWCAEHQVPESVCTRCDPALAAAFQATNDWCTEHGLPESQCLKCNPDLKIVRPPKPEGM